MEMALNMGAFEALDNREMMEVDGGGLTWAAVGKAAVAVGKAAVSVVVAHPLVAVGVAAAVAGIGVALLVNKNS